LNEPFFASAASAPRPATAAASAREREEEEEEEEERRQNEQKSDVTANGKEENSTLFADCGPLFLYRFPFRGEKLFFCTSGAKVTGDVEVEEDIFRP